MAFLRKGGTGWLVIAAGVVAWDLTSEETLTGAFRRARQHPAGFAALTVGWAVITCHLFGVLPDRADPIHCVAKRVTVHAPRAAAAC